MEMSIKVTTKKFLNAIFQYSMGDPLGSFGLLKFLSSYSLCENIRK